MQDEDNLSKHDRTRLLAIFTYTYFFAGLAAICFAPLLPFIGEDLLVSKARLGLCFSLLYLGSIITSFPSGWLADRWGVPRTLYLALLIQGLSLIIVASVLSFYWMLFFLLISGLGFGAVNPATSKGIIDWFTVKWRATAMAIKQTGFTAGTMVAAATLPAIAEAMGWRWAVAIVAGLVILSGISSYPFYPSLVTNKKGVTNKRSTIADISGEESVWKNRRIILWSFLGIFYAAVQISGTAYLSLYMVDHFLYSKVTAGIFLAVAQGGGTLGRIVWGRISDVYFAKSRHKEILMIGFIAAATCIILGLLPAETHYIIVAVVAAVFGFTAMGYNAVFLTFIGEMAGPENAGRAIGLGMTIAYVGVVIGPPAFGFTVDILGYKYAWVMFGGIFAMVIAFTFMVTAHGSPNVEIRK